MKEYMNIKPKQTRVRKNNKNAESAIVPTYSPTFSEIQCVTPPIQSNEDANLNTVIEIIPAIIENDHQLALATPETDKEELLSKKRGRKPKGGKIVMNFTPLNEMVENKPNCILHLKCSMKDLNFHQNVDMDSYNFSQELSYGVINEDTHIYLNKNSSTSKGASNTVVANNNSDEETEIKEVWKKLKQLEHNLHINNVSDKKSACFWCTHDFDNPPIYIPKYFLKDSYHVYGCFCSPECSVAHLMEENIDSSTKFERYHLLNHIYSKIYDYKKNIKPAPNPYYMLEKYYGNLSIQEYRALLSNERLFLIVDKPLTRIMPELHQDNEEHIMNNKIIPSNNYNVKKKLARKVQTKNNIVSEKFGMVVVAV